MTQLTPFPVAPVHGTGRLLRGWLLYPRPPRVVQKVRASLEQPAK